MDSSRNDSASANHLAFTSLKKLLKEQTLFDLFVIVRICGHAHQSAYPDMLELSPFTGCQHFPAFVKAESKLGLFPGNVQL